MSAARDKVIGSTIRNTAEMLPMATGKRRINSEVKVLVAQAALVIDQAAQQEIARVVSVAQEALAGLAGQVAQEAQAELVVRVAPAGPELETVPAGVEREPAPVAGELELDRVEVVQESPVVAELEPDQAEAALAPGHPRGQPGVVPRTKSVTAAHRRDLVLHLVVEEDLAAAVAGTTREPAAAEGATAWEVADIAVVVAEDAAAEE
jgi:hypothetical protein